ncbi:MAG: nucleotidyltransferase family protein [Sphingomicrobium sp.]
MTHERGLILAAGAGRRFGGGKLLSPWRGQPLINWSIAAAWDSGVDAVTVVLGAEADQVAASLARNVDIVVCAEWDEGIAASLRCGLAALPGKTSAVLILLGDMPNVSPALGRSLLDLVGAGAPAAIAQFGEIPAHPVAVNASAFGVLATVRGDRGARSALADLAGVRVVATGDPGSVFDIDYASDTSG